MPGQGTSIHGPYEDLGIAGLEVLKLILEGQDPATRKELWNRFLEITKSWHDLGVSVSTDIVNHLKGLKK